MKLIASAALLAVVAVGLSAAELLQQQVGNGLVERQGRSLSNSGNANMIEVNSYKSKLEMERRQVQEFLTAKNILKSIVKLIFGSQQEMAATSRNVISNLSSMLDLLKATFGAKSRGSGRTTRSSLEDAANAGISVIQGYVRSVLADDKLTCVQRYLCESAKNAMTESRELGYIIASVGGYATSYLLDNEKTSSVGIKGLYDSIKKGRASNSNEECHKAYPNCDEDSPAQTNKV